MWLINYKFSMNEIILKSSNKHHSLLSTNMTGVLIRLKKHMWTVIKFYFHQAHAALMIVFLPIQVIKLAGNVKLKQNPTTPPIMGSFYCCYTRSRWKWDLILQALSENCHMCHSKLTAILWLEKVTFLVQNLTNWHNVEIFD